MLLHGQGGGAGAYTPRRWQEKQRYSVNSTCTCWISMVPCFPVDTLTSCHCRTRPCSISRGKVLPAAVMLLPLLQCLAEYHVNCHFIGSRRFGVRTLPRSDHEGELAVQPCLDSELENSVWAGAEPLIHKRCAFVLVYEQKQETTSVM